MVLEKLAQHLKSFYISAYINGMSINQVLVDKGGVVNILSTSTLAKLCKSEQDLFPIKLTISNFVGGITMTKGVLLVELIVEGKSIIVDFFIIIFRTKYNALLEEIDSCNSMCTIISPLVPLVLE